MKNLTLMLFFAGWIVGCATPATRDQAASTTGSSAVQSSGAGGGVWPFKAQWWDKGIHFCKYSDGLDEVINRIETFETCPPTIPGK